VAGEIIKRDGSLHEGPSQTCPGPGEARRAALGEAPKAHTYPSLSYISPPPAKEREDRAGLVSCLSIIKITEGLGWKGPSQTIQSNAPVMSRDIFHWTRFLKASSNLTLNTPREGVSATPPSNLFQCLTTLTVKHFFLLSNLTLPSCSFKALPLVLSLQDLVKSLSLSYQCPLCTEIPRSLLFSRLNTPNSVSLSL